MLTAAVMPRLLKLPVGNCDSSLTSSRLSPSDAPSRGHANSGDEPSWLEFDEGGFLGHAARAYRYLKQGNACQRFAEQSIGACLSDHGRTRAQRYAILAAAYVQQGELEQAAAIGEQVVSEAWHLHSRHVDEEVTNLVKVVKRRQSKGGRDFLGAAREYLTARAG